MRIIALLLFLTTALSTRALAQDGGKKDAEKDKKKSESWEKIDSDKKDNENDRYESRREGKRDKSGKGQGNWFPTFPNRIPRRLENVPAGHYPPPGECRIWYPDRPAGHQPPPVPCNSLIGVRLEPGAFILHNDRAYDTEYNWKEDKNREREREPKRSIPQEILDILFPRRTRN